MVQKSTVVRSRPESAHHLQSALESSARHDIYWSNEFFYRWITAEHPQARRWSIFGRRPADIGVDVAGERFVVRSKSGADHTDAIEGLAADDRFPGAAVARARWLAKSGRDSEALAAARAALAGIESSR